MYNVEEEIATTSLVLQGETIPATVGTLTTALLTDNAFLKEGDQLTFVGFSKHGASVFSVVLDSTSSEATSMLVIDEGKLGFQYFGMVDANTCAACAILSREGDNGQHLRSTTALTLSDDAAASDYYKETAKDAAIESYMAANGNTDWPQEQL